LAGYLLKGRLSTILVINNKRKKKKNLINNQDSPGTRGSAMLEGRPYWCGTSFMKSDTLSGFGCDIQQILQVIDHLILELCAIKPLMKFMFDV
jgi:hypothetical protein